jgi:glycosyltransferase involved in cell wall biosynthesis
MRVLVDYRPALRERTGVGEYVHEAVRAYTAAHADEVTIFTSSWKDRPPSTLASELRVRVVDRRLPVRVLNYCWHRLEWPPVEVVAGPCDVVHALHPILIPARRAAQVVTVHDLFFLSQPDRTRDEIRRDYVPLAGPHARRADAVVTPSAHVKALVTAQLGVPADRIHVCAPGAPAWERLGKGPNLPTGGYVLFIGTLEPRKNLGTLLEAYRLLLERMPDAPRLVVAGRATPDAAGWLRRMREPPLAGRVDHRGYVDRQAREGLYAGARLLVIPSLDEGFGLPALEAMSAGIPVVVSNRGALPEVVGHAGVLVDPDDAGAIASAMERLLADGPAAHGAAHAGLMRARSFTWRQTAGRLRDAYVDAIARKRARAAARTAHPGIG